MSAVPQLKVDGSVLRSLKLFDADRLRGLSGPSFRPFLVFVVVLAGLAIVDAGRVIALDTRALAAPLDGALRACAVAVTLLAIALVVLRLH